MLTADHVGDNHCKGIDGLCREQSVARGLLYLQSYYSYSRNKAGCQVVTQLPKVSRIIEAVMRISDLSAETWSFATHAAMSALMTYLWEDPQWYPRSSCPTSVRSAAVSSQGSAVRTVCAGEEKLFSNTTIEVGHILLLKQPG